MTQEEYESQLKELGMVRDGEPFNGVVRYRTRDGTGQLYVPDTTKMTEEKRKELFDFQVSVGRFSDFAF